MRIHNPLKSDVPTSTWSVLEYEHALALGQGEKFSMSPASTIPGTTPFYFDGHILDREKYFSHFFPSSYHIPEIRIDVVPNAMLSGAGFIFTDTGSALWPSGVPGSPEQGFRAVWADLALSPTERHDEFDCSRLHAYLPLEGAYQIACTAVGNYHHLMLDIIPRLWALQHDETRDFIRSHGFDPDLIPIIINRYAPWVADHIARLGLNINRERILPIPHHGCVRANKLFVPHCLNSFSGWASKNLVAFYGDVANRLRSSDHVASLPRKVFHLRRDIKNDRRAIANVDAIAETLVSYGFEELQPNPMKPEEGWAIFANATHIVGAMGSNLSNTVFCRPGTRVLSIQSDASCFSLVSAVAAAGQQQAGYLFGRSFPETGEGEQVKFDVEASKVKPAIEALLDA